MPLMLTLIALFLQSAAAATPEPSADPPSLIVFGEQTTRDAITQVARVTGQAREGLQATPLEALTRGLPPRVVGAGTATTCSGALISVLTFENAARAAIEEVKNDNQLRALARARAVEEQLGCLGAPPDPALVTEFGVYWGVAAFSQGLMAEAHDAFLLARTFDPELVWPANLMERRGKALFDSVVREERQSLPVLLEVVPRETPLWVDGRAISDASRGLRLSPGGHLVHVGSGEDRQPVWIHLETGGGSTLVLPDRVDGRAVRWIQDPQRRSDLSRLLSAVLGQGAAVYVVPEDSVWQGFTGSADWSRLDRTPLVAVSDGLMLGGGGLTLGGGGAMIATWALGRQARLNNDFDTYEKYHAQFQVAEPVTYVGAIALGVGIGLRTLGMRGVAVLVAPDEKNSLTGVVVWGHKW